MNCIMNGETRITIILMCVVFTLCSCTKKAIPSTEDPKPSVVEFRASSQATWVKSIENSFPHNDFGVWGIARQGSLVYNLWGNGALMDVNKNTEGSYVPSEAAYWLKGYTYNFLAVAPYADAGFAFIGVNTKEAQTNVTNPSDYLIFTFDMSSKYNKGDYDFDLLGAAAQNTINAGGYSTAQNLMFWHLFSQIEIKNIGFASGISGTVNKAHLKAYPSGEYIVSYSTDASNSTSPTKVECEVIKTTSNNTAVEKSDIIFNNPNFTSATPIIHIIPQDVASLELYIDFTINEGTSQNPIPVQYQGFKIDLTAQELDEYVYNGKYNWSITIGTKNSISFDVLKVNEWIDGSTNNEFPLQ